MKFSMFDTVVTTTALPQQGLVAGQVGAIVDVYDGDEYEVEFCNEAGETLVQIPLSASKLTRHTGVRRAA